MLRSLYLPLVFVVFCHSAAWAVEKTEPPVSRWKTDFKGPTGLTLSYDGVPIIRQSSLYVVKPGWAGLLFDGRSQNYQVTSGIGAQPTLTAIGENENFRAEYHFDLLDEHHFQLRFQGQLKRDVPASLEYAAGYFNANLLANRSFRAQTPEGEKTGVIPDLPKSDDQMANDVAPHFQSLEFDSRLGQLKVEAHSASRVVFFDARRDPQQWAKSAPIFWCGWTAGMQSLRFGQPVEMTLDITLDPKDDARHEGATARAGLQTVAAAQSSIDRPIQIIPKPQKLVVLGGTPFSFGKSTRVSIEVPRGETRLTRAIHRLLSGQMGVATVNEHEQTWTRLVFGTSPAQMSGAAHWRENLEGYRLRASREGIEIVAPTPQGAFYGLQTLGQLLRSASGTPQCPAVRVEDWPSRAFRGAHWFPSASGVPFDKKLIANVLARYKFNACVIQCEAARWDSDPKIAAPNSISKADLRSLVQLCRENFIEPIPLINVPGHADWMFRNGRNVDLAEDPAAPYAYAVNNPRSLPYVKGILSEAIEVFHPKIFHLGHDEVTMRGRFPNPDNPFYRPGVEAGDLVLENLNRLHDWLGKQHIQTMVWSDMFLSSAEGVDAAQAPSAAEAARRRALVPRDVLIADWHYGTDEKYLSSELFRKSGLESVAATWNDPLNIHHFAHDSQGVSKGLLQTTWAGFFPDETTLKTTSPQFAAFVLAGDYAWSNRNELPAELPYDPATEWSRAYSGEAEGGDCTGASVDLNSVATVPSKDWLGLGAGWDLTGLSAQGLSRRFDDVLFSLTKERLVVLVAPNSRELAPTGALASVQFGLHHKTREIALLQAALWPTPVGTLVARMKAKYSDGTQAVWDLVQGREVASWQLDRGASQARRGWVAPAKGPSVDGAFGLRVGRWVNPHPEKSIDSLRFEAVSPESGWILAGLTLLD